MPWKAGTYRAGDRLREEEVAQRLKVSRSPVREALGRLAARGFVTPAGGRGLIVRSLDISEVLELYTMRAILEGAAARLAAEHASQPEIDALTDIEQAFAEHPDDRPRWRSSTAPSMKRSAARRALFWPFGISC